MRSSALTSKTEARKKMDKRRLRITMKVLGEAKAQFPNTAEFTEERQEQECLKENISVEEVIFLFTSPETKS